MKQLQLFFMAPDYERHPNKPPVIVAYRPNNWLYKDVETGELLCKVGDRWFKDLGVKRTGARAGTDSALTVRS